MELIQHGDHVVIALPAVYETSEIYQEVLTRLLALRDTINPAITVTWLHVDPPGVSPRVLFIERTSNYRPYPR